MTTDDLTDRIAKNLKLALERSSFASERALAKAAHVSDATVRNLLRPDARPPNSKRSPSPTVATIEKLAEQLGLSAWQLLYADFNPDSPPRAISQSEADMYAAIRASVESQIKKTPSR